MNPFQEGADYLDKLIADRDRWKALAERAREGLEKIADCCPINPNICESDEHSIARTILAKLSEANK